MPSETSSPALAPGPDVSVDACERCRWEMACIASAAILGVVLATAPAYLDDVATDQGTEDRPVAVATRTLLPREA